MASVDLDVFITDVNDNAPKIILNEKVINVVEGTKLGYTSMIYYARAYFGKWRISHLRYSL